MSTKPTAKKAAEDDVYEHSFAHVSQFPGYDPLYGLPSFTPPASLTAPVVAPDDKKES
jgi:hypothetical protein